MKLLIFIIACLVLFALNQAISTLFPLFGVAPNLFLIITIIFAFDERNFNFLFTAIIGGFLQEIAAGFPFGTYMLALVIIGGLMRYLAEKVQVIEGSLKFIPVSLIIAILGLDLWIYAYINICALFGLTLISINAGNFSNIVFWQILYSLLVLMPVYACALLVQNILLRLENRKKGFGVL